MEMKPLKSPIQFHSCEYPDNLDRTWNNPLLSRLKRTIRRYLSAGAIKAE
jgi:hypothetical protein